MPPKKGKSSKNTKSKGGKKGNTDGFTLAEDMEEYAKVIKCLGDRKLTVVLTDTSQMLALIPGRFRKRVWINSGDVILVSRRDFQDGKLDVIAKYDPNDVKKLHKMGMIPDFFIESDAIQNDDPQGGVQFLDSGEDEDNSQEKDLSVKEDSEESESSSESEIDIDNL